MNKTAGSIWVDAPPGRSVSLTRREAEVLGLVVEGKSNKEIAAAIYLSPKTVEYHLANTFRKLDIHSRAELARIVAREGTLGAPSGPETGSASAR